MKFIDFTNDGYTRTDRKKSSCNLRDTDHAKERYQEIVDLVRFGKSKLNLFTEKEYYEENARCILTVWGQKATQLNDYANRGWGGLTYSYYRERWKRFTTEVITASLSGQKFDEKQFYEGKINIENGNDWNQTAPVDTKPTLEDFKKTVSDYLAWEVTNLLKNQSLDDERLGK